MTREMRNAIVVAFALGAASVLSQMARGEPPPGANPAYSPFYHSITTKEHQNGWCCSQDTDCREVASKRDDGQWFVLVTKETFGRNWMDEDKWLPVPESAIAPSPRDDVPRPISAVACVYQRELRCFTPPAVGG
jgi:hypothetical protein